MYHFHPGVEQLGRIPLIDPSLLQLGQNLGQLQLQSNPDHRSSFNNLKVFKPRWSRRAPQQLTTPPHTPPLPPGWPCQKCQTSPSLFNLQIQNFQIWNFLQKSSQNQSKGLLWACQQHFLIEGVKKCGLCIFQSFQTQGRHARGFTCVDGFTSVKQSTLKNTYRAKTWRNF